MIAGIFIGILIGAVVSWVLIEAHWRWVDRPTGLNRTTEGDE